MANPAKSARLEEAAKGFTDVHSRGPNWLKTINPITKVISLDVGMGGGWHHNNNTVESDSAWQADTGAWQYKIEALAGFKLNARNVLNAGNLVQWTDLASGQTISFQPLALNWVDNVTDSRQQIAQPQAISATVSDDVLLFQNGYGSGRHFKYKADVGRLNKVIIIDSLSNLATPTVANPYLEIEFVITPSSGVGVRVNGSTWDKRTKTNTAASIGFRLSNGTTVWSFAVPKAYDSLGSEIDGIIQLRKQGANLYCTVRFPKTWINTAMFPIFLDPTVDYQVGAGADDGQWRASTYSNNGAFLSFGASSGIPYNPFFRWTGVTIPTGATISTAYVSLYKYSGGGTFQNAVFKGVDEDNPTAISSYTDGNGRTKTTANVTWAITIGSGWNNSPELKTIIQELVDSYNFSSGSALEIVNLGGTSTQGIFYSYDGDTSYAPKLHIEYTTAAKPLYAYAQQ